jgi:hypothetical protein
MPGYIRNACQEKLNFTALCFVPKTGLKVLFLAEDMRKY